MNQYERNYVALVRDVLYKGHMRAGRNGVTRSLFGRSFVVPDLHKSFPLLHGRKMHYAGVLGELAALIRGPKHVNDFKRFGCNYWDKFAAPDGSLVLDYGTQWLDFNGVNQLAMLIEGLQHDPYGRRHIINSWRPDRLADLTLPCCHFLYQFYVTHNNRLDMIWYQRSADMMIGVPSDVILAALLVLLISQEANLLPGEITMVLGDCHIYEEHVKGTQEYLNNTKYIDFGPHPISYEFNPRSAILEWNYGGKELFVPDHLKILDYNPMPHIDFELKI